MMSITNIFSTDDSNKTIKKSKKIDKSPAINQGKKFKKYQNKISNSLEKNAEFLSGKEGFAGLNENGLTAKTNKIIDNNDYSEQQKSIDNLRQEYDNALQEYQNLLAEVSGDTNAYIIRVNPNNPYLNKTVRFTTGHICYVTNQGVVKYIPSPEILNSINVPKSSIELNIPYLDSYQTPGTQIPTNPPLVSGTNVEMGQSFGSEGSNVFVNQLLPDSTTASYMGCFSASPNNDNMTFIGGAPPPVDVSIKNGDFSQSQLPNNTYKYLTWDVTTVPGWNFNCVLLNNSSAWGYPMPYPNGNQCASIQKTQQLWTNDWINFNTGVTYTLSFSACGRNCCDGSGKSNPINIGLEGKTLYTLDATVGQWKTYSFTFTVDNPESHPRISFIGTWTAGDRSTAIKNVSLSGVSGTGGKYTLDDCKREAIQQGYQYFALQNVNTQNSTGYCAVSKSSPAVSQYGEANIPSKVVALWSSNTAGQPGNTAILSNTGSLKVINSSGQAIYSSPATNANSTYIGCYGDTGDRAMQNTSSGKYLPFEDCKNLAKDGKFKYFATQNASNGNGWCAASNDLSKAKKYGIASNCTVQKNNWMGGPWSNAIYSVEPEGSYFMILQDDGNMVIYRGTGPSDNQGAIWSTQTNGKQQAANPNMVASKGKYGKNWMPSNGTLSPGDFVGSSDGKMALVMQADGNLVLYTYQMETNCRKMNDGNMGGGLGANAAYDIGKTAISGNIGKLAFIDSNAELHPYPDNNQTFSTSYTTFKNLDSYGNDIPGAAFANATLETCETACNKNSDCAGFVLDIGGGYNKGCWPKTKQMYPYGGPTRTLNGVNLYVRNKIPSSPPIGVKQNTNNIDTVKYAGYKNGGQLENSYGLANVNSVQKQQLEQLETKLNMLTNQINGLTSSFKTGSSEANYQGDNNVTGINQYIKDIKKSNLKSKEIAHQTAGGIQNILKDSDIVVLQKNYDYLFWSILAAGTVLVSMNVVNK